MRKLLSKRLLFGREWLYLWSVFTILIALAGGFQQGEKTLLYSAINAAFLGVFALLSKHHLKVVFTILLLSLGVLSIAESIMVRHTWQTPRGATEPTFEWINTFGRDQISERKTYRFWRTNFPADSYSLSFDVRLIGGVPSWYWRASSEAVEVSLETMQDEAFTRISNPPGGDPWTVQEFSFRDPVGGRALQLSLEMRGHHNFSESEGKVYLYANQETKSYIPVRLSSDWSVITFQWTPPQNFNGRKVSVVLNDFDDATIDVRKPELAVRNNDEWRQIPIADSAGLTVWLDHADRDSALQQNTCQVEPKPTWTSANCTFADLELQGLEQIRVVSLLEPQLAIETRRVRLSSPETTLTPISRTHRFSAIFLQHPNLLGHTVAIVGVAFAALTTSRRLRILFLLMALVVISLSGSRAAAFAGLFSLFWLGMLPQRKDYLKILFPSLCVLFALIIFVTSTVDLPFQSRLIGGEVQNPVTRVEIWRSAWQGFSAYPVSGISELYTNFSQYWQTANPEKAEVAHAHNFWLQFAVSYGIFGLLASLWLTGGFLYLGWHRGRWRGLALVIPVFIMQIFDYTLFYSGVLYPLILGLNALRPDAPDDA